MSTVQTQIAAKLESAFSQYGFAEPSVAKLKQACGVSLRTLYKYYGSKEEMIVAALEYRHQRYLALLKRDVDDNGLEALLNVIGKLTAWMRDEAPNGCMSLNACTAFPNNQEIAHAVQTHKQQVGAILGEISGQPDKAEQWLLLHEGVVNAWPIQGELAIKTAQAIIQTLYKEPR